MACVLLCVGRVLPATCLLRASCGSDTDIFCLRSSPHSVHYSLHSHAISDDLSRHPIARPLKLHDLTRLSTGSGGQLEPGLYDKSILLNLELHGCARASCSMLLAILFSR